MTDEIGACLALDWGGARIGVAACGREGLLSYPVETVQAGPRALDRLLALVAEYEPARVIIGFPRSLAGGEGPAAVRIRGYAEDFAARVDVPVILVDERMSTVGASKALHAAGRNTRQQRSVIDQAAAVAILDGALDARRARGSWPGTLLSTMTPASNDETRRPE